MDGGGCLNAVNLKKARAKVLQTCLQVQILRQGNIRDYNIANAKLMRRLKRHEAGDGPLSPHIDLSLLLERCA